MYVHRVVIKEQFSPKSFGPLYKPDILSNPIIRAEFVLYWIYPSLSIKLMLPLIVEIGIFKKNCWRKPPMVVRNALTTNVIKIPFT